MPANTGKASRRSPAGTGSRDRPHSAHVEPQFGKELPGLIARDRRAVEQPRIHQAQAAQIGAAQIRAHEIAERPRQDCQRVPSSSVPLNAARRTSHRSNAQSERSSFDRSASPRPQSVSWSGMPGAASFCTSVLESVCSRMVCVEARSVIARPLAMRRSGASLHDICTARAPEEEARPASISTPPRHPRRIPAGDRLDRIPFHLRAKGAEAMLPSPPPSVLPLTQAP